MNVLLTCAGRRHYLSTYFREALAGKGLLIGADMDLTAPALTACDRAYQVPSVNSSDYIECIIDIIRNNDVQMVFSLNDLEVGLFSENRERIEAETGATVFVPDLDAFLICSDKWATYCFSRELGIPTIPTYLSPEDALLAVEKGEISFPLIVKPRWGSASIAIFNVVDEESLKASFISCAKAVLQSMLAQLGTNDAVIIQKFIVGPEYGLDILFDAKCEYQGFTAKRKFAMRSGETDKAVTVPPDRFEEHVSSIARSLRHRGNLDCDFIEQDDKIYLLEMNPRFGGGYPFSHLAGANHAQHLIDGFMGKIPTKYAYETNLTFAKCDILVPVPFAGNISKN
jgi:carbamoyl-phosphate synthase large subunit